MALSQPKQDPPSAFTSSGRWWVVGHRRRSGAPHAPSGRAGTGTQQVNKLKNGLVAVFSEQTSVFPGLVLLLPSFSNAFPSFKIK